VTGESTRVGCQSNKPRAVHQHESGQRRSPRP
jgi:hypothetical protein